MKGLGQNQDSGRTGFRDLNSGIRLSLSLSLSFVFPFSNVVLKQVSFCEIFVGIIGSILIAQKVIEKGFLLLDISTELPGSQEPS